MKKNLASLFSAIAVLVLSAHVNAQTTQPATAETKAPAKAKPSASLQKKREINCSDRIDNDKDSLIDCFDADCYNAPECKSGGGLENTNLLCSDGIDNDGDGVTDCEDMDCSRLNVTACKGSWQGPLSGTGIVVKKAVKNSDNLPVLGKGKTVEDMLGQGPDKDGERNDYVCSDGIDNDGDGMVDCQDYGCRFDPSVTVCSSHAAGIRFSVAAHVKTAVDLKEKEGSQVDTRFSKLQLRAFGAIPGINNSFFLLSVQAEDTVRLTFATFEVPLYKNHRLNINSGSGGLSNNSQILGTQKRLLLDLPYYLFNAFEGGNGAAIEVNGPIVQGLLDYRVFGAGGTGKFDGNLGGHYYKFDNANYTWAAGAQLIYHAIGRFDRFDTRFLYTPVPTALSLYVGGRYDQRVAERYPAANVSAMFRSSRFLAVAEGFIKRELEFETTQFSFNVQLGVLVIPKWLMLAGDFGMYRIEDFGDTLPDTLSADEKDELKRLNNEMQWRVAAHLFFYRNTGVFTVLYKDRKVDNYSFSGDDLTQRELRFEVQYRF